MNKFYFTIVSDGIFIYYLSKKQKEFFDKEFPNCANATADDKTNEHENAIEWITTNGKLLGRSELYNL